MAWRELPSTDKALKEFETFMLFAKRPTREDKRLAKNLLSYISTEIAYKLGQKYGKKFPNLLGPSFRCEKNRYYVKLGVYR